MKPTCKIEECSNERDGGSDYCWDHDYLDRDAMVKYNMTHTTNYQGD